ncbi:hypothetical protein F4824DRAFT_86559 [Ustulina deusta]|nr:hypothetical protein F4824DRAFT_86559 [Ustulina deusta]
MNGLSLLNKRFLYLVGASLLLSAVEGLDIFERQTNVCKWYLEPNDCIGMNSMNGAIMNDPTSTCFTDMGRKISDLKRHVGHNFR